MSPWGEGDKRQNVWMCHYTSNWLLINSSKDEFCVKLDVWHLHFVIPKVCPDSEQGIKFIIPNPSPNPQPRVALLCVCASRDPLWTIWTPFGPLLDPFCYTLKLIKISWIP